jgi:hypothetical protein
LTSNEIILNRAKEVVGHPTPVNGIEASKVRRFITWKQFSEVDDIISNNLIGEIINLSQIFNSYYWNTSNVKLKQKFYNLSSILSSMSQVEIDKAKKLFDFSMQSTLYSLKRDSEVDMSIKPMFFKHIVENPEKCEFITFETPMDFVVEEVSRISQAKRSRNIEIGELLKYDHNKYSHSQAMSIIDGFEELYSTGKDLEDIRSSREALLEKITDIINLRGISNETLCYLIKKSEDDISTYKNLLLNLLYETVPNQFIEIFNISRENISKIEPCELGDITIFGKKFIKNSPFLEQKH